MCKHGIKTEFSKVKQPRTNQGYHCIKSYITEMCDSINYLWL